MTILLIPILGLAAGCSLALPTALKGDSSTSDATNATQRVWNSPAAGAMSRGWNASTADAPARERECVPAADRLGANATLSDRAGRYRLTLVADSSASDSSSAARRARA